MPKLLSSREIIKILEKNHFIFISQKGSHGKFYKEESKAIVIVPMNKEEVPVSTFLSIIRQSKMDRDSFM